MTRRLLILAMRKIRADFSTMSSPLWVRRSRKSPIAFESTTVMSVVVDVTHQLLQHLTNHRMRPGPKFARMTRFALKKARPRPQINEVLSLSLKTPRRCTTSLCQESCFSTQPISLRFTFNGSLEFGSRCGFSLVAPLYWSGAVSGTIASRTPRTTPWKWISALLFSGLKML